MSGAATPRRTSTPPRTFTPPATRSCARWSRGRRGAGASSTRRSCDPGREPWAPRSHGGVVQVAPPPALARLERTHERVLGGPEVRGRVSAPGRVAAADVSAGEAHAEVNPALAEVETLLAPLRSRSGIQHQLEVGAADHADTVGGWRA